jgi:hypothetical protein
MNPVQTLTSHILTSRLHIYPRRGLSNELSPSPFPIYVSQVYISFAMRATSYAHPIVLYFNVLVFSGKEYKLWSPLRCNFSPSPCIGNKNFIKPFPFKGWTRLPSLMKIRHKRSTATLPWPTDQHSGWRGQHLELNLLRSAKKSSEDISGECRTSQHIKLIWRPQHGHSSLGTIEPVMTF